MSLKSSLNFLGRQEVFAHTFLEQIISPPFLNLDDLHPQDGLLFGFLDLLYKLFVLNPYMVPSEYFLYESSAVTFNLEPCGIKNITHRFSNNSLLVCPYQTEISPYM